MGKYHWKVEKQPEWYVKAVRKTIAALPGGYAEAADWLDVTENALFNRLRADGDQIFPLGWAMVLQRAAGTHYIADAVAQSAGGVFVSLPEIEEVENADINQRLLEVIEQIRRAGGVECLESWLLREKGCQWPHSDWHSENMTTMRHAPGAIRLCWHCDNQLRDQFTERLESMATDNCARWVLSVVRRDLGFDDSHVVTMPELCWWLIRNDLADALPESAARKALRLPEKEAIVDNGAHFDGDQSGTVNGVTPPAVQHLTAEVTADSGEYQVLARWDTPKVVKGVSFLLRLTVAADDGSERLVSTARTTETTYRFTQLALGNYRLTVRAVNAWGQQGDPASVSFRIAAPAAPSRIELTPGYFQITATPHLAVYDPTVQFEFWFSETRITDIRQVETTARYLGTGLYWIAASINIKPGHDYYFYIRSVNTVGKSAFVEAVGQPSDDASGYLDFFKGEIHTSQGVQLLQKETQ